MGGLDYNIKLDVMTNGFHNSQSCYGMEMETKSSIDKMLTINF